MVELISVSGAFTRAENKDMTFETGLLAPLAGGAVTAQIGGTCALVTATAAKSPREGADFFPLTVDVEERMYAAGRIPGSFFRRESRAGEQAILACRLIDRPLRPSFPEGFRNEVHVVVTVLGADQNHPYDMLALNAASLALAISPIPFDGPIGAVKLAWTADGEWIPFPTYAESEDSAFEMVVAGRMADNDVAVMTVEAGGTFASWDLYQNGTPKVNEEILADGLEAAKTPIREAIELQQQMVAKLGSPQKMSTTLTVDYSEEVIEAVRSTARERIVASQSIADKTTRQNEENSLLATIATELGEQFAYLPDAVRQIHNAVRDVSKEVVRERIVVEGVRIDGRMPNELRSLSSKVGVISSVHGSGLFQRGETQVLNVSTLGLARRDLLVDDLSPTEKKRYFHHYNFPPFCTGEAGFMRGPKRREIGHGALAERALVPVLPGFEEWPYTMRTVSEVLASNGSSSMASVCASTLSLMDAGVPIKAPVAGVAMGLVHKNDSWVTLTDILGVEDAFGDMDFKVAGTTDFITALQLDTKISGIPASVLADALRQAYEARLDILDVMAETIMEPRSEVQSTAPKISTFEIPIDKIGEVIGPKGKVINSIQAETGTDISIDDDNGSVGVVAIASTSRDGIIEAEKQIKMLLDPPTAEVGVTYTGKVVNITKFGAFVNILPNRDGLLHISKLGGSSRVDRVEDVLTLGEELEVIVEDIDFKGKISLLLTNTDDRSGGDTEASDSQSQDFSEGSHTRDSESSQKPADKSTGNRGRTATHQSSDVRFLSFEDTFDAEMQKEFGDLGPKPQLRRAQSARTSHRSRSRRH